MKLKTSSKCKCPENVFAKYCRKSKYENIVKIFKNCKRRSSSLKTNWKIKSFTEAISEPCKISKKELLVKIVISFSFFWQKTLSWKGVWKGSGYASASWTFFICKNLRLPFMKSCSTDSLSDQNDCREMRRN